MVYVWTNLRLGTVYLTVWRIFIKGGKTTDSDSFFINRNYWGGVVLAGQQFQFGIEIQTIKKGAYEEAARYIQEYCTRRKM